MNRTGWVVATAMLAATIVTAPAAGREETIANPNPDRTWASRAGGFFTPGKSIAVVIAISDYVGARNGGYPALPTARHDADKMVAFLIQDAGFDTVYVLTDEHATKAKIDRLMTDVIPGAVGTRDRFLFYWSGHGDQMTSADGRRSFGFLPLANSRTKEFSGMVSMQDLERWDRYLDARQALFVLDACLSGLAGVEKKAPRDARLDQLSLPARHLLTAGTALESVISGDRWGGSLFTDSFIQGARGQASGASGVVSLFSLIDFIQDRVAIEKQVANWSKSLTPQLQSLQAGDGAFFFTPKGASIVSTIPVRPSPSQAPEQKSAAIETRPAPPPSAARPSFSIRTGAAVRGDEYKIIRNATSIQSCSSHCVTDARCKMFAYWTNNICYLFDRPLGTYPTAAAQVGYVRAQASAP